MDATTRRRSGRLWPGLFQSSTHTTTTTSLTHSPPLPCPSPHTLTAFPQSFVRALPPLLLLHHLQMRCFSKNAALSLVAFLLVLLKNGQAQHLRSGNTKATEGMCGWGCVCLWRLCLSPRGWGVVVWRRRGGGAGVVSHSFAKHHSDTPSLPPTHSCTQIQT